MKEIDFNNKTFLLVENSAEGAVDSHTIFKYRQEGDLVTADYNGGTIKYGKIIALLKNDSLDMLYQCLTIENELKAGKAKAEITLNKENKIMLRLDWQWLGEKEEQGISEYVEI